MGVERTFSFTSWANDHPSDRLPGDRVDAVFADHARAINALETRVSRLLRSDGKLNHDLLTPDSLPAKLRADLVADLLREARAERAETAVHLVEIRALRSELQQLVADAQTFTRETSRELGRSIGLAENVITIQEDLVSRLSPIAERAEAALNAADNSDNDAAFAAATAQDWASVSIEWAEHMPDTIPPNILAISAISGNHWSSRWWASQAASIVGGAAVLSWNGRVGIVTMTAADITSAGGAVLASPIFTGTPTAPTVTPATDASTKIATTAFVQSAMASAVVASWNGRVGAVTMTLADVTAAGGAPLASPTFTGAPAAPTPAPGDSSTKLATTAFVAAAAAAVPYLPLAGGTLTGALAINRPSGASRTFSGMTGVNARWSLELGNTTAEGSGNAGSDFVLTRYNDAGVSLGSPLAINRASGSTVLSGPVTFTGGSPAIDTASGVSRGVLGRSASKTRWLMELGNAVAETGSNVGADFALSCYADDGTTVIRTPLAIQRSTGNLTVASPNVTFSGTAALAGNLTVGTTSSGGTLRVIKPSGGPVLYLSDGVIDRSAFFWDAATQRTIVLDGISGGVLALDTLANFTFTGPQAFKTGGGSWAATSDIRIKNIVGEYERGLEAVLQLRPVIYTYKGNDGADHAKAAEAKTPYVGFIAQELETVFPEMVFSTAGVIGGQPVDDLRSVDVSPLVYALTNAVKELSARLLVLEGKPA